MDDPLGKRLADLIARLARDLERVARSAGELDAPAPPPPPLPPARDLATHVRRALRLYDQHRDRLDPAGRERLLEFVADDVVGLCRTYAPDAPAPAARREETPAAAGGFALLAEAGAVLASSLEYEAALDRVARLAVEWFADAAAVHLREGGDGGARVRRLAAVSREGEAAWLDAACREPVDPADPGHPVAAALRSGETVLAPGPEALLVEPLTWRGQVLGALTFARRRGGPPFAGDDLALASELARRCALAVEHARARDEAERARRARAEFIGAMSHELRTPLMTVTAFAHLIEDGIPVAVPAEAREHAGRILGAAGQLERLVEEALGFGRAEAGGEVVRRESADLAALAREAAALLEPLARQKGLSLVVEAEPAAAETDPDRVRQLLFHLLGNAVRFTDQGTVRLVLRAGAERAVFEVSDTGIGMTPEALERAFEPFWQADPGNAARGPGIGLGLPLARRLAWLLGGDVRGESSPGEGSTFRAEIPRG